VETRALGVGTNCREGVGSRGHDLYRDPCQEITENL